MSLFEILAVLVTLTALFAWLNARTIRLPPTIGVMLASLAFSLGLVASSHLGLDLEDWAVAMLSRIDFDEALLNGVLSLLLFAGALHVDLGSLRKHALPIATLATVGLVISAAVTGVLTWLAARAVGVEIGLAWCLVFGALISPTDPVAVLALFKKAGAPADLETQVAGESLFNDGVAVVVFLATLGVAAEGHLEPGHIALLLAEEVAGGVLFGLVTGWLAYRMLRQVDQYEVEVLVSLALVVGGYALAQHIHVSAPISVVVAGLFIGNHGRLFAMSERTRERLDDFWELIDEILNAVLFVLIGLEVLVLPVPTRELPLALAVIAIVLVGRSAGVALPMGLLRLRVAMPRGSVRALIWSGLRGGISVAMALSIPAGPERALIVGLTYAVVVFSVTVQGLTIAPVIRRLFAPAATRAGEPA